MAGLASTERSSDELDRWSTCLAEGAGEKLLRTLSGLPLEVLGRYPPPRLGRFPLGREVAVLRRRISGDSVQLHPSGLSKVYRSIASSEHVRLYRAFTLGEPLLESEWRDVLGADHVALWRRQALLLGEAGALRAAFRVVSLAGLRLLADAFAFQGRFANRVHIGPDTVALLDFVSKKGRVDGRHLDVGIGSGALLLALRTANREAVGVDVNPRAVDVARFNARLNNQECTVLHGDVFGLTSLGRFDRVTWNLPFHFMPEHERPTNVDGDGGDMGIELTLRFVERLPELLTESGRAYLLTSSPRLMDGTDLLSSTLARRAPAYRLDIVAHVLHAIWAPSRREFHRSYGICRFDNVILEIARGEGRVQRVAAPPVQRAIDWVQALRYDR